MSDRCAKHKNRYLFYYCEPCGKPLCADCVIRHDVGITAHRVCPECKRFVEPLGPGKVPFAAVVSEIIRAPFSSRTNLFVLLGCVGLCSALDILVSLNFLFFLNVPVMIMIFGVFTWFFALSVQSAARGSFDVPIHMEYSDWSDFVRPSFLFLGSLLVSWLPSLVWALVLYLTDGFGSFDTVDIVIGGLLSLYGIVCWPMASALVIYSGSIRAAFNPLIVLRLVARIPGGYAAAYGLLVGMALISAGFQMLVVLIFGTLGAPVFAGLPLIWSVRFFVGFVSAEILGGLLYAYCDVMGIDVGQMLKRKLRQEKQVRAAAVSAGQPAAGPNAVRPPMGYRGGVRRFDELVEKAVASAPAMSDMRSAQPVLPAGASAGMSPSGPVGPDSRADSDLAKISLDLLDLPELTEDMFSEKDGDNLFEELLSNYRLLDLSEDSPLEIGTEEASYRHRPTVDRFSPILLPDEPLAPAASPPASESSGALDPPGGEVSQIENLFEPISLPGPTDLARFMPDQTPGAGKADPGDVPSKIPMAVPITYLPEKTTTVMMKHLESLSQRYASQVAEDASYMLLPKTQWAVASHFEKQGRWKEAVEAYSKAGLRNIRHKRASEGLLRAAFLCHRELKNTGVTEKLLRHLIDHYPDAISTEKAKKVMRALRDGAA